ncbi:MAG: putative ATPase/class 3 adenylate cyclase [Halioglobus sp.]|jgi:class 3 adenylate cyclase
MARTDTQDITLWLQRIGMPQFVQTFLDNGIDFDLLPELTSQDLQETGIARLVDRKNILKEIRLLSLEKARSSLQRRVLSVFFCDMVGSTARSTEIDPEEFRNEMKLYQDAVVAAVNRHGGFVARFLGDGVLAYFGWPHADEDQASQAVRAGLDAITAVSELKNEADFPAHCRIGIATGRVVVGGQQDLDSAFGETPNLAARLQSLAEVDSIVIDSATRRAVGNRFILELLQTLPLKGFDQPLSVWTVSKERKYIDRLESRSSGQTAFVGREQELEIVCRAWDKTQGSSGEAIWLKGDPGIGKSRLVKQFCEAHLKDDVTIRRLQCSSHHTNSAFYPVIQKLEYRAGIDPVRDTDAEILEKIRLILHPSVTAKGYLAELIAALFTVVTPELGQLAKLSAQERRTKTIETIVENTLCDSQGQPTFIVLEDAHWIDPSTRLLLEYIIEKISSSPILIVVTSRQDADLELLESSQFQQIDLARLGSVEMTQIARGIDSAATLSEIEVQNIALRADGIPLFAEEIALAAIESDSRGELFELPESIEASLASRLDNLGDAKSSIQVASIIGREFKLPQLQALAATEDSILLAALGTAIASGLVREVSTLSDRAFRFTHALVQDVAYNGLLNQEKREYHRRLAMDVLDDSIRQREPELVALHLTCAGETEAAIGYWNLAAKKSAAASANAEAIAHFQHGLRLISSLPKNSQRDEREFALLVGMAVPLIVEKGYTSQELEHCISDALSIGKQIKYTPDIYSLLFSQWGYKLTVGLMQDSLQVANEFSILAEQQNNQLAIYARDRMLGATHMCLGELQKAKMELSRLIDNYAPEQHAALMSVYGVDLRVAGHCFLSEVLWLLGEIEEAKTSAAAALNEARAMQHPHSHAISLHFCSLNAFLNRDRKAVTAHIDEMMQLATEHTIGVWPTLGSAMAGWARLDSDNFDENIVALIEGVNAATDHGISMFVPFFYCRIAEEMLNAGRMKESHKFLNKADNLIQKTQETIFKGELLQLQARVAVIESDADSAIKLFNEGLAHARSQNALSVELRVATAYADFLHSQGDSKTADDMLQHVLSQFNNSTRSSDIDAGRKLLSQLRAGHSACGVLVDDTSAYAVFPVSGISAANNDSQC